MVCRIHCSHCPTCLTRRDLRRQQRYEFHSICPWIVVTSSLVAEILSIPPHVVYATAQNHSQDPAAGHSPAEGHGTAEIREQSACPTRPCCRWSPKRCASTTTNGTSHSLFWLSLTPKHSVQSQEPQPANKPVVEVRVSLDKPRILVTLSLALEVLYSIPQGRHEATPTTSRHRDLQAVPGTRPGFTACCER